VLPNCAFSGRRLRAAAEREIVRHTERNMFGKRTTTGELPPPPAASNNTESVEVLRAWAAPGGPAAVALRTTWKDPAAWGLMLVDVARHAANAYEREGRDRKEVLARIRQFFDAEWASPTDTAKDATDGE